VIALDLLDADLVARLIADARDVLGRVGVEVHSPDALALLGDHGARVDMPRRRAFLPDALIDRALATVPRSVPLYDSTGQQTHEIGDPHVSFTPGSSALRVLDQQTDEMRPPTTADYVRYVKVVSGLSHIAAQSTAFIPADVDARISDSYRLYLSLSYGEKPVVTGAFSVEGLAVMRDLQLAVRGTGAALRERPLAIFSCCPTSPLQWSATGCHTIVECARAGVPIEIVPMPLAGLTAPVTLTGAITQHAAEALSGIVLHQLAVPGAPLLYGGSTAIFDVRHESTPMGAVETMLLACACARLGRHLGVPTQAYIALSDAKTFDAQAGAETAMGAVLAALSGINHISGPGMLDFENGFSLEKLVLDNELCGMALRVREGIVQRDRASILPLMTELLQERHLLIADHTRQYLRQEIRWPSAVIDRTTDARWTQDGRPSIVARAAAEASALQSRYVPPRVPSEVQRDLTDRMLAEARRFGAERLPERPCAA
jgi:trimethylamine--corrinoid protein Co-methyltransferase